jgi:SAM-dependent methyltransferase
MMIHTRCPLGGSDEDDVEVFPANFDVCEVSAEAYAPKRLPEKMYYRMVKNSRTGSLRADPILDDETVMGLYRSSKVNREEVSSFATATYLKYLERALPALPDRRGVLEIGCGHGFFLEPVMKMGFSVVKGVEPSADAVAKAPDAVRPHIVEAPFGPGLFAAEEFSLVCGFQVLDHLLRPNEVLQECLKVMAPGGVMYWICHDTGSPFARLLGTRSPMLHIQHVILYDKRTIARLFERNGFEVVEVFGVRNRYPLSYWWQLLPAPRGVHPAVAWFLGATGLGRLALSANFGNLGIIARKPLEGAR